MSKSDVKSLASTLSEENKKSLNTFLGWLENHVGAESDLNFGAAEQPIYAAQALYAIGDLMTLTTPLAMPDEDSVVIDAVQGWLDEQVASESELTFNASQGREEHTPADVLNALNSLLSTE